MGSREPKSPLLRFFEAAIIFAMSAYLIKLGCKYLVCSWSVLKIIILIAVIALIIYRIWKFRRDRWF